MEQIESTMFINYPDVVKVDDLMTMLHIGRNKAYELLNINTIQSIMIGKKQLIPKYSIREFIKNN